MKKLLIFISVTFILLSCTTTIHHEKSSWSKKPMFASLFLDEIEYTLNSTDNQYGLNKPVDFELILKNTSDQMKEFKTSENKFLVCTIKSEYPQKSKKINILSSDMLGKDNFNLLPGEERVFNFSIVLDEDIIKNNEYIYCKANLYFLKRQLRRNSLTIYLERN